MTGTRRIPGHPQRARRSPDREAVPRHPVGVASLVG